MTSRGNLFNSAWFSLDSSRGLELEDLKVFMRHTVIISELMIYIPAVLLLASLHHADWSSVLYVLLQPGLLLIDHGHFQYNCVMLGLFAWSIYFFHTGRIFSGSIAFVLCISFKQMALYYSPAVFVYLLAITFKHPSTFLRLATTTVLGFLIVYGPFAYSGMEDLLQVVRRIFPFGRGLFEDKVANFWCATNVIVKYKELFTNEALQRSR